jgi:non-ribosomal peptide synthetase component F/thioesterase domain-containing protein/SAM-dependent methyltransferase/acyl carrier protein
MMKISDFQLDAPVSAGAKGPGAALRTVEEMFRAAVDAAPDATALTDDGAQLTFSGLDGLSSAIAGFILSKDYGPEAAVGVLCRRGAPYLAAALGSLRAGAVYVPVERELPPSRLEHMLRPARLLITDRHCLREAERLRYANPGIRHILCVDVWDMAEAIERGGPLSSTAYWEAAVEQGADMGWRSWLDAARFSSAALEEMAAALLAKTRLAGMARRRVLDIGCGSGVVARALAGAAESYTAVDISVTELDRVQNLPVGSRVRTHRMEAVDIGLLADQSYDLVCLNGVAECFPGYGYLRRVLDQAVGLLAEGGTLFVGAVLDLGRREALREALTEHARSTGENSGLRRLDTGAELFIPERFFTEWAAESPVPVELCITRPAVGEAELSGYRLDVVIRRSQRGAPPLERARFGMADAQAPGADGLPACAPDQAAYIVYTSGSTGLPKGVVVEHRNLAHILNALRPLAEGCRSVGLVAPLSFDASIQQLAVSIFCGKPLHVLSDEARKNPDAFCERARRHGLDLCDMTPAFFNVLVDHLHERRLPLPVGRLLLAGEVLRPDTVRKLFSIPGNEGVVLYNVYGPTECTVDSSVFRIDYANHAAYTAYPIGRPLEGVSVSIRSGEGAALPEGERGEIWISGDGVARGYLDGASPGAFILAEGRPCYKTGDFGRMGGGLLQYLGREDQQVKIRGNRVEIGEVETAVAGFPGVRQVAVVAETYRAEEGKSLAAYVVGQVEPEALRGYLEGLLPSYCVPAYIVPMQELPFSFNRKVDKRALPSPLADRRATGGRKPAGEVEERLAAMFKTLLGVAVEDADANFFALGGNSIMAIRLAAMIEKELGVRIPANELFTHASVALLAGLLAGRAAAQEGPVIELCRRAGARALFLFHPIGGSVFCYRELAEKLSGVFTVYAVEAAGFQAERNMLNMELHTVEDLARHYLGEILKHETDGIVFGGWSFGGLLAYEAACLYAAMGNRPEGVVVLDSVADNSKAKQLAAKDDVGLLKSILGDGLDLDEALLRSLPHQEKLAYLVDRALSKGSLPEGFSAAHMDSLLRTYRGNAIAAARYDRPTASELKVLLVRALDFASNPQIIPDDEYQGWNRFLRPENITLRWTEGTHESMLAPGLAGNIARHIMKEFDNA